MTWTGWVICQRPRGSHEPVEGGERAEDGGQQAGEQPAVPRRGHHRAEEGDERQFEPQPRRQQGTKQHRTGRGDHGQHRGQNTPFPHAPPDYSRSGVDGVHGGLDPRAVAAFGRWSTGDKPTIMVSQS